MEHYFVKIYFVYSLTLSDGLVCFLFFVPLFVLAPGSPLYMSCILFGALALFFLYISALFNHQKKKKKQKSNKMSSETAKMVVKVVSSNHFCIIQPGSPVGPYFVLKRH